MRKISVLKWVPPFARGSVKELRVRWALEEAGLPYEEEVLTPEDQDAASYRARQPFGQVPAYEDGEVSMFESGAIVLHIAEKSDALMPRDAQGHARTMQWMFAALTSIQPAVADVTSSIRRRSGRRCAVRVRKNFSGDGSASLPGAWRGASGWRTGSRRATS